MIYRLDMSQYRNHSLDPDALLKVLAHGYSRLSLVVFKESTAAVRRYKRLGYENIDIAPIVPHPLMHYGGKALLMVASVSRSYIKKRLAKRHIAMISWEVVDPQ